MEGELLTLRRLRSSRCFVEDDAGISIGRRSLAEGIGTAMLMVAVVGSGMQNANQPLSSAFAVSGALVGLIVALGSVSGGHFNPVITVLQWLSGERGIDCTLAYVAAQVSGGLTGTVLADLIFAKPPGQPSLALPSFPSLTSEALATFGLMLIVFCCSRSVGKLAGPLAVGAWLLGAIVSTPTGSIANPAVAVSLLAAPSSASVVSTAAVLLVQFAGGGLALRCVWALYPADKVGNPNE
jgi:glycerol uptake facilitator-like aquaporin